MRATLGSSINRLEKAADNLANVAQNTSASKEAEYWMPTMHQRQLELAKTQIIQQAATAMLAQANQQARSVLLALLR